MQLVRVVEITLVQNILLVQASAPPDVQYSSSGSVNTHAIINCKFALSAVHIGGYSESPMASFAQKQLLF